METYRGFIINQETSVYEETEWDGHRNDGTGRYSTSYYYQIINPKNAKYKICSSYEEAKCIVDTILDKKKEMKQAELKLKRENEKLDNLKKKIQFKIDQLSTELFNKEKEFRDLKRELSHLLISDFIE